MIGFVRDIFLWILGHTLAAIWFFIPFAVAIVLMSWLFGWPYEL